MRCSNRKLVIVFEATRTYYKLSNPSQGYSSEVKTQIKSCEKWGSCHTEHEGGFVSLLLLILYSDQH